MLHHREKRKCFQKLYKKPRLQNCQIRLSSLDNLFCTNNQPLYTKKMMTLINGKSYQPTFRDKQANLSVNQTGDMKDLVAADLIKCSCTDVTYNTYFDKQVKKCIDNYIKCGTRYLKTKNEPRKKNFKIAPIRLYKHNLYKHRLSHTNNGDSKSQKKNLIKSVTGTDVKEQKYNSFLNDPFVKDVKMVKEVPTKLQDISEFGEDLIRRENVSMVTKSQYQRSSKPRLSKENIQGLIQQSLVNVMNKRKKTEQLKISLEKSDSGRRSTISESRLSESGDFGNTNSEPTWNPLFCFSLDATDMTANQFHASSGEKSAPTQTLSDSYDVEASDSKMTNIALRETDNYIASTKFKEHRTLSGYNMGQNELNKFSQQKFRFDGNYSYVDGVNWKTQTHRATEQLEFQGCINETFSALSHMYSLRKLLDRRSMKCDTDMVPLPRYSCANLILNHEDSNDDEDLQSESMGSSFLELHRSIDTKLIENFKRTHK